MPQRHSLRIVIQQIGSVGRTRYRIIAYGGKRPLGHADYPTADLLMEALRRALPNFDLKQIAGGDTTTNARGAFQTGSQAAGIAADV